MGSVSDYHIIVISCGWVNGGNIKVRPITAKGGITGTDLPRVTGKAKIKYISMRPRFNLAEVDVKAMDKVCKRMVLSRSEWMRRQVSRSLGNE